MMSAFLLIWARCTLVRNRLLADQRRDLHLSKQVEAQGWPEMTAVEYDSQSWPDIDDGHAPHLMTQEDLNALTPRSGARAAQRNYLSRMMCAGDGLNTDAIVTPVRHPIPYGKSPDTARMAVLEPDLDPDDPKMDPKLAKILRENSDPTSANASAARAWVRQQLKRHKSVSFGEALEHSIISPSVAGTAVIAANRISKGVKSLPAAQRLPSPGTSGVILAADARGASRPTVGV